MFSCLPCVHCLWESCTMSSPDSLMYTILAVFSLFLWCRTFCLVFLFSCVVRVSSRVLCLCLVCSVIFCVLPVACCLTRLLSCQKPFVVSRGALLPHILSCCFLVSCVSEFSCLVWLLVERNSDLNSRRAMLTTDCIPRAQ